MHIELVPRWTPYNGVLAMVSKLTNNYYNNDELLKKDKFIEVSVNNIFRW